MKKREGGVSGGDGMGWEGGRQQFYCTGKKIYLSHPKRSAFKKKSSSIVSSIYCNIKVDKKT
jgi:hypothetical protein